MTTPDDGWLHLDVSRGASAPAIASALAAVNPEFRQRIEREIAPCVHDKASVFVPARAGGRVALRIDVEPPSPPVSGVSSHGLAAALESLALGPETKASVARLLHRIAAAASSADQAPVAAATGEDVRAENAGLIVAAAILTVCRRFRITASPLPLEASLCPAALELARGFRFVAGARGYVSPMALALLSELGAVGVDRSAEGVLVSAGTGIDHHGDETIVLHALQLVPQRPDDEVVVLTFDVDDMTGEEVGNASEQLRALSGVLDLSLGTRMGKKQRPATEFRLLVRPEAFDQIRDQCFVRTSTIGLRWRRERRAVLARNIDAGRVGNHILAVKTVLRPDGVTTAKAESVSLDRCDSLGERRAVQRLAEGAIGPHPKDVGHE